MLYLAWPLENGKLRLFLTREKKGRLQYPKESVVYPEAFRMRTHLLAFSSDTVFLGVPPFTRLLLAFRA